VPVSADYPLQDVYVERTVLVTDPSQAIYKTIIPNSMSCHAPTDPAADTTRFATVPVKADPAGKFPTLPAVNSTTTAETQAKNGTQAITDANGNVLRDALGQVITKADYTIKGGLSNDDLFRVSSTDYSTWWQDLRTDGAIDFARRLAGLAPGSNTTNINVTGTVMDQLEMNKGIQAGGLGTNQVNTTNSDTTKRDAITKVVVPLVAVESTYGPADPKLASNLKPGFEPIGGTTSTPSNSALPSNDGTRKFADPVTLSISPDRIANGDPTKNGPDQINKYYSDAKHRDIAVVDNNSVLFVDHVGKPAVPSGTTLPRTEIPPWKTP